MFRLSLNFGGDEERMDLAHADHQIADSLMSDPLAQADAAESKTDQQLWVEAEKVECYQCLVVDMGGGLINSKRFIRIILDSIQG